MIEGVYRDMSRDPCEAEMVVSPHPVDWECWRCWDSEERAVDGVVMGAEDNGQSRRREVMAVTLVGHREEVELADSSLSAAP